MSELEITAPLTSSQAMLWSNSMAIPPKFRAALNLPRVIELASKYTKVDVEKAFRGLIIKHEALRTRICVSRDGTPEQVVDPITDLTKMQEILFACDDAEFDRVAGDLARELAQVPIDIAHTWPWRVKLARNSLSGALRLCLVVHHTAADLRALIILEENIKSLLGQPCLHLKTSKLQPRQIAEMQSQAQSAQRRSAIALKHWEVCFKRGLTNCLPFRSNLGGGRISMTLESRALFRNTEMIAQKLSTSFGTVITSLVTSALMDYSNVNEWIWTPVIDTRDSHRFSEVVGSFSELGLIRSSRRADSTVEEFIQGFAKDQLIGATRIGCSYTDLLASRSRISFERGTQFKLPAILNLKAGRRVTVGLDTRGLRGEGLWVDVGKGKPDTPIFLVVDRDQETAVLSFDVDTSIMCESDIRAVLEAVEHNSCRLALDIGLLVSDLTAFRRVPEGFFSRRRWVDDVATRNWLMGVPGVESVDIKQTPDDMLSMKVSGAVSAKALEDRIIEGLDKVSGLVLPDILKLDEVSSSQFVRDHNASSKFMETLASASGLDSLDEHSAYLVQGGDILRIPGILVELEKEGFTSVSWEDLASFKPLRMLSD